MRKLIAHVVLAFAFVVLTFAFIAGTAIVMTMHPLQTVADCTNSNC
jgi:hypothetical protein